MTIATSDRPTPVYPLGACLTCSDTIDQRMEHVCRNARELAAPEWTRTPPQPPEERARAKYRGLDLNADSFHWSVYGIWQGYEVTASHYDYSGGRPSVEDNMAAAIVAADDLLAKGWQPS